MSWTLIWEHLFIVLAASILSVCLGLPLGIWAYVSPKARAVILRVVDLLQTIPSLALLGIIMVFLDPGKLTVIRGITLYSLLPIVRNTCLGLQEVDPGVKEAARGMGMSKAYRVLRVEFPLAPLTVFAGIRIAAETMLWREDGHHIHPLFQEEVQQVLISYHTRVIGEDSHPFIFQDRQVQFRLFIPHNHPLSGCKRGEAHH